MSRDLEQIVAKLIKAQMEGREEDVKILISFLHEDLDEVLEAFERVAYLMRFESE